MTDRDASMGPDGLTRRDRDLIRDVLARYPEVRRVTLFGSRAMGTFGRGSDIDLALEGPDLDARTLTRIATELEDSDLPYKVDLLLRDEQLEPKLEAHIRRHGKLFGWDSKSLECAGITLLDCVHKTPAEDVSGARRYVAIPQMVGGRLDIAEARRISESDFIEWTKKANPQTFDVVLSRRCNPGETAYVAPGEGFAVGQNLVLLRADGRFVYPPFLRWLVRSPAWWTQVESHLNVGAVFDSLKCREIPKFKLPVPPLGEQRAIAGVLGALDDKIEQNRRTAQALEQLARAIFRAWFVDFEPVEAKAAGATSFPSMPQSVFDALPTRFVDSPIGSVPEGWAVKAATDVATVAIGKTPPRKEPQWFTNDPSQIPWVSIRDMGTCGVFIGKTSEYLINEAVERFRIRRIPDRSVLLSFKLTVGRVTIADGEITSNEAIAHFVSGSPDSVGMEYLYCYLIEFDHSQLASTSSIATATNSKIVKELPILVPASSATEAFTELTRPMFDAMRSLTRESSKLAALRDYLLPKLLSGSVRVKDAERTLETTA